MSEEVTNTTPQAAEQGEQQTFSAEDVQKLRDQKMRLDAIARDWEKKYKEMEGRYAGIEPEKVREILTKNEELERKAAETDPKKFEEYTEKRLLKQRTEYEEKLGKTTSEVEQLKQQVKRYAVTDKVMSQVGTLFNDDVQEFIKGVIERHGDLDEDGNIVFRDDKGEIEYHGVNPLSPKQFGERLAQKYPSMAKSTVVGGGKDATPGQKKSAGRVLPSTPEEFWTMPNAMQVWGTLSAEDRRKYAKGLKYS